MGEKLVERARADSEEPRRFSLVPAGEREDPLRFGRIEVVEAPHGEEEPMSEKAKEVFSPPRSGKRLLGEFRPQKPGASAGGEKGARPFESHLPRGRSARVRGKSGEDMGVGAQQRTFALQDPEPSTPAPLEAQEHL